MAKCRLTKGEERKLALFQNAPRILLLRDADADAARMQFRVAKEVVRGRSSLP